MPKFAFVDDYLASLPAQQRAVMEEIERRVLAVVPAAERVIRYDMPTWQVEGTSLVHAAAWKQHVSLYPVPPEGDATLDAALAPYTGRPSRSPRGTAATHCAAWRPTGTSTSSPMSAAPAASS